VPRCEECGCVTEDARDWIALLAEEEPGGDSCVVVYCPVCAEREFDRAPRLTYT
jgi:hypothetical protein